MMRPTLLGSLLEAASHNVSRNGPDLAIFESGTVYRASQHGHLPDEHQRARGAPDRLAVACLVARHRRRGGLLRGQGAARRDAHKLGVAWSVEPAPWPFLHPGRSAYRARRPGRPSRPGLARRGPDGAQGDQDGAQDRGIGFLGELHPLVAGAWGLARTAVFAVGPRQGGGRRAGGGRVPRFRGGPVAAPRSRRDPARDGARGRGRRARARGGRRDARGAC